MSGIATLLRTCPKPFFQQQLQQIEWRLPVLSNPELALQVFQKCGKQDKSLGRQFDIPAVVAGLDCASAIAYVAHLGKIKGERASPETYKELETLLEKQEEMSLDDVHMLIRHYTLYKISPPVDLLTSLLARFYTHLPSAQFSQIITIIRYISIFQPILPATAVDPQQIAPLLAALKQTWPALELKVDRQSSLIALAHAFVMMGISNVELWRLMLTDLIGMKKGTFGLMGGNISAFALKKSGVICETLTPEVYADLAPLWREINELYRMEAGYLQRGELESALSRRVTRALVSLKVNLQKTGLIDEVFAYDVLIGKMNMEIDGPAHFIRWTNGWMSGNQHWYHCVRDRVLEKKGYQVTRWAYWDLEDLHQEALTEKLASILNIKI